MTRSRIPVTVLIVACLFLLVGAGGFVGHFRGLLAMRQDSVWVELTELLAIVAGIFMLLRQNWARWLAVAWLAFHVAISYPNLSKLAVHLLFLALISVLLFRPESGRFFAAGRPPETPTT